MSILKFASAALLGSLLVSGCGLFPRSHPEKWEVNESVHSLQELCDYPKEFFTVWFKAEKLKISSTTSSPTQDKIGSIGSCSYKLDDGSEFPQYLGNNVLERHSEDAKPTESKGRPGRTLTIDGVPVSETHLPNPSFVDDTTRHYLKLTATIDGWDGELEFNVDNDSDPKIEAGAQVVVKMIRALKG
ncbi:hypothetical protein OG874_02535 [Nocardia sp. NBC_00565]|uniref:hypothetical protein n=1 Tax=Nocardia sp. NBC_00565 TaxID=2975993 RepID=UPI002E821578|nr:hypothetical protein [Nocardia sp. NBC_00565]WUC04115.1 hypothetical protein OG874_02535 [Nocardia sp. NBC_00565]